MTKELEPKQTEDLQYFFDMAKERFVGVEGFGLEENLFLALQYYFLENAITQGDSMYVNIDGKSGKYLIWDQTAKSEAHRKDPESGIGRSAADIPGLEIYGDRGIEGVRGADFVLDAIKKYHEANPEAILPTIFVVKVMEKPADSEDMFLGKLPEITFMLDPFEQSYPKLDAGITAVVDGQYIRADEAQTTRALEILADDLGIKI